MELSSGLDVKRALLLSVLCGLTYQQYKQPYGNIRLPPPYRVNEAFHGDAYAKLDAFFGFLLESDQDAVLVFRGTAAPDEWVTDAIARQIPYPYVRGMGRSHEGITELYASMRERILQAVLSLPPGKPLYVTGHSLGGALAALAAPDLAALRGASPIVYTFGAPRVGSPLFAIQYCRAVPRSYRMSNTADAVTHLPTILYRSPITNGLYLYWHVKSRMRLSFRLGSLSANHALQGYFNALARLAPAYAASLRSYTAGWTEE